MNLRMVIYYATMCNVPIDVLIDAGRTTKHYSDDDAVNQQIITALQQFSTDEKHKVLQMLQIAKS